MLGLTNIVLQEVKACEGDVVTSSKFKLELEELSSGIFDSFKASSKDLIFSIKQFHSVLKSLSLCRCSMSESLIFSIFLNQRKVFWSSSYSSNLQLSES